MLVLSLDTATTRASACLWSDGAVIAAIAEVGPRSAQVIVAALTELVDDRFRDLDAVAVGVGPGSFTGLRIGIAAARGIGCALKIPVSGVSSLAALSTPGVLAVIDARRGELFVSDGSAEWIAKPAELANESRPLVGDGALRYREQFHAAPIAPDGDLAHTPNAAAIAAHAAAAGFATSSEPRYLRAPDAAA